MGDEKNLKIKIYSITLLIFISILILCSSFITFTFRLFLDHLIWGVNTEMSGRSNNSISYEKFVFWVFKLSFWLLISLLPFEILSKNKKINIIIYLFLTGIYIGILVFINLYLVNIGMVTKIIY